MKEGSKVLAIPSSVDRALFVCHEEYGKQQQKNIPISASLVESKQKVAQNIHERKALNDHKPMSHLALLIKYGGRSNRKRGTSRDNASNNLSKSSTGTAVSPSSLTSGYLSDSAKVVFIAA